MTAILLIGVVVWLFWPQKTRWHPFGGIYKWDKRTGKLTVAVTLPTKRKKARRRK